MTPIELNVLLSRVREEYGSSVGIRGNCGVFAVALKQILEDYHGLDVGLVGVIGDEEPEYIYHVAVEWNDEFFDIYGRRTEEDLEWIGIDEEHPHQHIDIIDITEEGALRGTQGQYRVEEIKDILFDIWREEQSW